MLPRPGLRLVGALVVAALAAACGTTVPAAQRQQAGPQAAAAGPTREQGLDAPVGATDPTLGLDGASGTGASGTASAGGSRGTTNTRAGGSSGSGAGSGETGSGGSTANGPGVTDTEIFIGIGITKNAGAANAAIGAAGITTGDEEAEFKALIDDINANGGLAGRKVVGVEHPFDTASTKPIDTIYQEACDDWTQDHKIFIAMTGTQEVMLQCLHERGVFAVEDNLTLSDEATFRRFPYYVEVGSLNLDRAAAAEVPALKAQGWFSGWNAATGQPGGGKAKVGVLTYDRPAFAHAADEVLVPALAALGYGPDAADVVKVTNPQSTQDTGAVAAAVSGAVLKFRSDKVSHVIILDASAVLTLLFLNNAESQHYRPRYGFTSQNGPQALLDPGNIPQAQLIGSKGIGWIPSIDITPSRNPPNGPYSNDARRACLALMSKHGITFSDANAESIAYAHCNEFWLIRDAFKRMGDGPITRDALLRAVESFGTSFQAANGFETRFGPGRHDGAGAARYYAYDGGCGCMTYTSANVRVE
jgi:hypothetical protein